MLGVGLSSSCNPSTGINLKTAKSWNQLEFQPPYSCIPTEWAHVDCRGSAHWSVQYSCQWFLILNFTLRDAGPEPHHTVPRPAPNMQDIRTSKRLRRKASLPYFEKCQCDWIPCRCRIKKRSLNGFNIDIPDSTDPSPSPPLAGSTDIDYVPEKQLKHKQGSKVSPSTTVAFSQVEFETNEEGKRRWVRSFGTSNEKEARQQF